MFLIIFEISLIKLSTVLKSCGRLFQVLAATYRNDLKDGTARRVFDDDRNIVVGTWSLMRSARYGGCRLSRRRYTTVATLTVILARIGNKCSFFRDGVMWSLLRNPVTTRQGCFGHVEVCPGWILTSRRVVRCNSRVGN